MDERIAAGLARALESARIPIVALLLAAIVWTTVAAAGFKPYWHDELYTLLVSRLPSAGAIWRAHLDGADLQPPLNTWLTRSARQLFGAGPVATRLPALVGFWLMTALVFLILKPRAGMTLALAGALIPVQTAAFRYSYEARGYGLMLGLFALALYAWMAAARGRRRRVWLPVLSIALAAGVWTHYYAVLAFTVVVTGEAVRQIRARRIDIAMTAAILGGVVLTLPLAPLLTAASAQSAQFWARGQTESVASVYQFLVGRLLASAWTPGGGLLLAALVFSRVTGRFRRHHPAAGHPREPLRRGADVAVHEAVALTVAVAMPAALLLAAQWLDVPFSPRYTMAAIVGIAMALPVSLRMAAGGASLAEAVLVVLLVLPFAQTARATVSGVAIRPGDPFADRALLAEALKRPGRVVASGSLTFLQIWYYAPPAARTRLVYLADPESARRFTGSDTIDRGYLALARWVPLPVMSYAEFVSRHRAFTVYAAGSGWLIARLEEDGARLELAGAEAGGREYRVTTR